MKVWAKQQKGFTIVELLIVIVVIGILAAIVIVAYTGVQNRANDAAVQSDLRNMGGQINQFLAINSILPAAADFPSMNLKVTKSAYGADYIPSPGANYNFIYCTSGTNFILVAASKSGNVFVFNSSSVKNGVGPLQTFTTTCANNGLSSTGIWFYNNSAWQAWVN